MGNQGSKLHEKPKKSKPVEQKPQFRRSDTQTSTRSIMSTRSSIKSSGRRSVRSTDDAPKPAPSPRIDARADTANPVPKLARSGSSAASVPTLQTMHSASSQLPTDADREEAIQQALPFPVGENGGNGSVMQIPLAQGGSVSVDDTIQTLLEVGYTGKTPRNFCLKANEVAAICRAAQDLFLSQPTLLELSPPVKIVGDVHGQYGDLLRMFRMCGFPPSSNYLFLGDYVDRGKQSLETILLLLCYKIKHPENFFILRGNHECAGVTRIYGFYDECKRRSSIKTWRALIDTFNTLPIAAVVAQKIFCVHGGLSPSLSSMDEVLNIERPTDVPEYGLLNDLLWSDPTDGPNEWEDNERGVSYCYNKVAINKFLQRFGFDLVCRAHMVVEDGYEFFNDRSLVTVFSAPNYCGEFDNWGAVMSVSEDLLCSFELLKPLDRAKLKEEMRRERDERLK